HPLVRVVSEFVRFVTAREVGINRVEIDHRGEKDVGTFLLFEEAQDVVSHGAIAAPPAPMDSPFSFYGRPTQAPRDKHPAAPGAAATRPARRLPPSTPRRRRTAGPSERPPA